MYLFVRVTKQTVVITEAYKFVYYMQNFIQHSALKVNSTCTADYWGSSVWTSTQQVNY